MARRLPCQPASGPTSRENASRRTLSNLVGRKVGMPTRITEVGTPGGQRTTLRVEGTLGAEDAELIGKICRDLRRERGKHITLDLADLSFIDSDSAHILCRLRAEQGVMLEGLHLFIQCVIEMAEQDETAGACVLHRSPRRRL